MGGRRTLAHAGARAAHAGIPRRTRAHAGARGRTPIHTSSPRGKYASRGRGKERQTAAPTRTEREPNGVAHTMNKCASLALRRTAPCAPRPNDREAPPATIGALGRWGYSEAATCRPIATRAAFGHPQSASRAKCAQKTLGLPDCASTQHPFPGLSVRAPDTTHQMSLQAHTYA